MEPVSAITLFFYHQTIWTVSFYIIITYEVIMCVPLCKNRVIKCVYRFLDEVNAGLQV